MTDRTARPGLTRRAVMQGLGVGGLSLPLLASCGGSGSGGTGGSSGSAGGGSVGGGGAGSTLARTSQVPVGGGTIIADQQVVVTQPHRGDFKAFSAVCTHQGCLVSQVADGAIDCPCHGSRFSIKDGSVVGGPAPTPLPPVTIKVKAGKITRA